MRKPDPESLSDHATPALVEVKGQRAVFVANVLWKDSGWIRVTEWEGAYTHLPPHRVLAVRCIETERRGEPLDSPKRIADPDWREKANEWTGDDPEPEDTERRVIA